MSNPNSNSNRWAPICYPSSSIFARTCATKNDNKRSTTNNGIRSADPFFPLHKDVVLAAMRELLIIDGKIDPRTMKVIIPAAEEKEASDMNQKKKRARSASATETNKVADGALPTLSDDDEESEKAGTTSLGKRQRLQNSASVDSILELQNQLDKKPSAVHVVPIPERRSFHYSQFDSAEELVEYIANKAAPILCSVSKSGGQVKPTQISTEEHSVTSKRKVSDVDDSMETQHARAAAFPPCVVSLVRSNILIFETFSSGAPNRLTKLQNFSSSLTDRTSKLPSQMTMTKSSPGGSAQFEKKNDAIIEFLHHPQVHRQRQHGLTEKSLLVLPQLLEASVTDETQLREFAHKMVVAMIGDDFEVPLRVFLGYKSTKTPSFERILDMACGVLFDVSHAMHAWLRTEKDMLRKLLASKTKMSRKDMDEQIKNTLFEQNSRAINNIGGFDDSSLLTLALGIHRQKQTTWAEYASSEEGKNAFGHHYATVDEPNVRKRQNDIVGNSELFEAGRKRRGRRGRLMSSLFNA